MESVSEPPQLLAGCTGIVFGVANKRSLAWACTKSLAQAGMRLALTYASERMERPVRELAADLPGAVVLPCDVTKSEEVEAVFAKLRAEFGFLDTVVHAIAYAKREELEGDFYHTSKAGYMIAHEVSAYSLTEIARCALPLMEGRQGSIVTLTYIGGERVVKNYNVMGIAKAALEASVRYMAADLGPKNIRVNAVSAGPIKTLAASGIGDFRYILKWNEYNSPLRRTVTIEEVGDTSVYLLSDMGRGVTGEVHHVDAGYHIVGMKAIDAPDIAQMQAAKSEAA